MKRSGLLGALASLIRIIDHADSLAAVRAGSILQNARVIAGRAEQGIVAPPPWTPFVRTQSGEPSQAQLATIRRHAPEMSEREARELMIKAVGTLFINSRYLVSVIEGAHQMVHLSIKRIDQSPVHDWRDLERIKDELLGPECEAVELYPARSRLVDAANQYHLWGVRDPAYRFPFGFDTPLTLTGDEGGAAQRPREV